MASIEREVEKGLLNAVSGVTGVNPYTSERGSPRTLPSLVAQAQIGGELLGPFTGLFNVPATITYTARADGNTRQAFDQKFQSIVAELYRDPDLASSVSLSAHFSRSQQCSREGVEGSTPSRAPPCST